MSSNWRSDSVSVALGEMKAEDDAKLEPEEAKVEAETKSRMMRLVW